MSASARLAVLVARAHALAPETRATPVVPLWVSLTAIDETHPETSDEEFLRLMRQEVEAFPDGPVVTAWKKEPL